MIVLEVVLMSKTNFPEGTFKFILVLKSKKIYDDDHEMICQYRGQGHMFYLCTGTRSVESYA